MASVMKCLESDNGTLKRKVKKKSNRSTGKKKKRKRQ